MLFKSLEMEIKADIEKRSFTGYASKFGNIDLHNDIIEQGAFKKTIQERMPKNMIKVFWQHMEPIGMPKVLEEDSEGLYVEGNISKVQKGNEAIELMRDGVVDGMSIGYDVVKDEFDENHNIRRLKELKLYEVSIVTWGANPEAGITNVKHLQALNSIFKEDNIKRLDEVKNVLDRLNDTLDSGIFETKNGNIVVNMEELKAGRVLSKANRDNLSQAVELIKTVLDTAGEPSNNEPDDDDDDEKSLDLQSDEEFKTLFKEIKNYVSQ